MHIGIWMVKNAKSSKHLSVYFVFLRVNNILISSRIFQISHLVLRHVYSITTHYSCASAAACHVSSAQHYRTSITFNNVQRELTNHVTMGLRCLLFWAHVLRQIQACLTHNNSSAVTSNSRRVYTDILSTSTSKQTRNVGQGPTWWPPCWIQVVPSVQRRSLADTHY